MFILLKGRLRPLSAQRAVSILLAESEAVRTMPNAVNLSTAGTVYRLMRVVM